MTTNAHYRQEIPLCPYPILGRLVLFLSQSAPILGRAVFAIIPGLQSVEGEIPVSFAGLSSEQKRCDAARELLGNHR